MLQMRLKHAARPRGGCEKSECSGERDPIMLCNNCNNGIWIIILIILLFGWGGNGLGCGCGCENNNCGCGCGCN